MEIARAWREGVTWFNGYRMKDEKDEKFWMMVMVVQGECT